MKRQALNPQRALDMPERIQAYRQEPATLPRQLCYRVLRSSGKVEGGWHIVAVGQDIVVLRNRWGAIKPVHLEAFLARNLGALAEAERATPRA
jgi:hypothetical protein